MKYQKKRLVKEHAVPIALAAGLMAGWITTMLFLIIITTLIAGECVAHETISIAAVITIALASFTAAMFAAKFANKMKLGICIASGALYWLSLLCCAALCFDGSCCGLGSSALTIIGSATIAGFISNRQKKHKTRYLR